MSEYARDKKFFEYAQLATAFSMTKAMHDCELDPDTIIQVNWVAHTEWKTLLDSYEETISTTPENTRSELASLIYDDLVEKLKNISDIINGKVRDNHEDDEGEQ